MVARFGRAKREEGIAPEKLLFEREILLKLVISLNLSSITPVKWFELISLKLDQTLFLFYFYFYFYFYLFYFYFYFILFLFLFIYEKKKGLQGFQGREEKKRRGERASKRIARDDELFERRELLKGEGGEGRIEKVGKNPKLFQIHHILKRRRKSSFY